MLALKCFFLVLLFIVIGYLLGNILFGLLFAKIKKIDLRSQGSGNIGATNTSRIMGPTVGIVVLIFDMFKGWLAIFLASIIYQTLGNKIINDHLGEIDHVAFYEYLGVTIYVTGLFVIIGHCYPIFYIFALIKFKGDLEKAKSFSGGKGAASTAGVFTAISPWIFLIAFLLFIIIFLLFRYVSLASMIGISTVCIWLLIPQLNYFYILKTPSITPIVSASLDINDPATYINYQNGWYYILTVFIISNLISLIVCFKHKDNIKRLIRKEEKHLFNWPKNGVKVEIEKDNW